MLSSYTCFLSGEVSFESLLYLFWQKQWKLCKDIFFLQSRGTPTSTQPLWIWQVKRLNAAWGSTKWEKVGAYLQDVGSQFKYHFTVNLNEFLERWRKQERKRELSCCKKDIHLFLTTAWWSMPCQFSPLARLQSIPCAPGDKREEEPAHSDMEKAKYSV